MSPTRLLGVRRSHRLARNLRGRDLVVGDLHGHRSLLERELRRIGFDPARDRVLSVGDLVNRGPDSLWTLALIEEPWFHAVLGNHEMMLLDHLGYFASRQHARKPFPAHAGDWIVEAASARRKTLERLADRVAALPLALHVDADLPFNVMHGDLGPIGATQRDLIGAGDVCVHDADAATSSRLNIADAEGTGFAGMAFARHAVRVSDRPFGPLHLTYVGHTRVRDITVHNSYVYIDLGGCGRSPRPVDRRSPTVLDAARFSCWLHGATLERGDPGVPRPPATASRGASRSLPRRTTHDEDRTDLGIDAA